MFRRLGDICSVFVAAKACVLQLETAQTSYTRSALNPANIIISVRPTRSGAFLLPSQEVDIHRSSHGRSRLPPNDLYQSTVYNG